MRRLSRLLVVLVLTGCGIERPVPTPASLPPVSLPPPALVPPAIMSRFGDWRGAGGVPRAWQHSGIDIRVPIGTPVLAAADGEVIRVATRPEAGKMVVLAHGEDLSTVYMHLAEIGVQAGQQVQRGEPIGRSGMTGNATTPHLHFGVCRRPAGQCGAPIGAGWDDPMRYFVDADLCYEPRWTYPSGPIRLTYPLPCQAAGSA